MTPPANRTDPVADALFLAAKAGDPKSVDDFINSYNWWILYRARRPPPLVDADDAESFARHAVWKGLLACPTAGQVLFFATTFYRRRIIDIQRLYHRRIKARNPRSWDLIVACDVTFLSDPDAPPSSRTGRPPRPALPCVDCGTAGGYVMPGRRRAYRVRGRCQDCHVLARKASLSPPIIFA